MYKKSDTITDTNREQALIDFSNFSNTNNRDDEDPLAPDSERATKEPTPQSHPIYDDPLTMLGLNTKFRGSEPIPKGIPSGKTAPESTPNMSETYPSEDAIAKNPDVPTSKTQEEKAIKKLQYLLVNRGLYNKIDGQLTPNLIQAAIELENEIINKTGNYAIKNMIISNGKFNTSIDDIENALIMIDKYYSKAPKYTMDERLNKLANMIFSK